MKAGLMRKVCCWLILGIVVWWLPPNALLAATPKAQDILWVATDAAGKPEIHLYFFWSASCPHCQEARPFIEALPQRYPWLKLHSLEVASHPENLEQYMQMAVAVGEEARAVPGFLFCGEMVSGYGGDTSSGAFLTAQLEQCYRSEQASRGTTAQAIGKNSATQPVSLPWLGEVDPQTLSLPAMTVILAGVDSFNPCAFFILLFLLSLLAHARSRARMLLIGGTFVLFSGIIYFLFMAAWLNAFRLVGQMQGMTLAAGVLAVVIALINIKDYFWFRQGVTLSIPEQAKPGLFRRMRGLLNADSLAVMLVGTVVLAVAANSYELLCTAGFPMVFTRILTLHELAPAAYYAWLALYNLIYVIPLLVIVMLFVITLGSRKLSAREGRTLKLLSGLMMLELGLALLFVPTMLDSVWVAVALLLVAIVLTFAVTRVRG